MSPSTRPLLIAVSLLFLGCGAGPGTRPHDMSTMAHHRAADHDEAQAAEHAGRSDPGSTLPYCGPAGRGASACWTSIVSLSEEHRREAERLQRLAAEHRAAAAVLAEAERTSCATVNPYDRDISPFFHRQDIASVKELQTHAHAGAPQDPGGALIVFRQVQGLTAESLRTMVNCHIARAAATGHEMPEMSYCPLALKSVKASVSGTADGLAVEVSSDDSAVAAEILRRAFSLMPAAAADGNPR